MFYIYFSDNCDTFQFDNKQFSTLAEARSFCDGYVKDDTPYCWADVPNTNNHYHFEVYEGPSIDGDPVYQTAEYYK